MTSPLRVGFLSGVRHAGPYAEILAADPRVELIGVAEDPAAPAWMHADGRRVAEAIGVPFRTDPASFLANEAPDVVIVCSEPTRHADLAIRALEAGRHVLVDKPVATDMREFARLSAAAARADGTISVVNRLCSPAVQRLRRWIDAGHLGLPLHVDAEWFASGAHFATSVERPELVVDPTLSGGGELLNFLLYPVDYITYLTGLEVVEVYCETATLFSAVHAEHDVEDSAVVSMLLDNGVTATVTLGRVPAAPGLGPVTSSVRILGSHGNASADDDKPAVTVFPGDGRVASLPVDGDSSTAILRAMFEEYVGRLAAGLEPVYPLARAGASLGVAAAAYESAASGRPVRLDA
jgi:myo-inositol 2-dehydrogenase/D-chiro-inositol 1-dehydrogenase